MLPLLLVVALPMLDWSRLVGEFRRIGKTETNDAPSMR
jgi:hypothetical protein